MSKVVRLFPPASTQEQRAADAYREMCETFQASAAAYATWLREAAPDRDDAMLEAEGRSAQLRQLAMLHTKGAGI
jgi:triphosphoribosyl-dephospho-CoA synthetase